LIFGAVAPLDQAYDEYKYVMVAQYLHYLPKRRELVVGIQSRRNRFEMRRDEQRIAPASPHVEALPQMLGVPLAYTPVRGRAQKMAPSVPIERKPGPGPKAGGATIPEANPRQVFMFDLADVGLPYSRGTDLGRMPKGQTVELRMQPHQSLSLTLATCRFVLSH
jgi:hypothetical protein